MKKRFLIFLFLLLNCSLVFSQITTDRPDQTESAVVLSSGQIQIESGISIENSQSNINTLFRIGIIDGIEIRINSNYLINDELSFMKKSSFSDFEAISVRYINKFIPKLMLPAFKIAIFFEYFLIWFS